MVVMPKADARHYFFGGQLLASAVWRAPKPCGEKSAKIERITVNTGPLHRTI